MSHYILFRLQNTTMEFHEIVFLVLFSLDLGLPAGSSQEANGQVQTTSTQHVGETTPFDEESSSDGQTIVIAVVVIAVVIILVIVVLIVKFCCYSESTRCPWSCNVFCCSKPPELPEGPPSADQLGKIKFSIVSLKKEDGVNHSYVNKDMFGPGGRPLPIAKANVYDDTPQEIYMNADEAINHTTIDVEVDDVYCNQDQLNEDMYMDMNHKGSTSETHDSVDRVVYSNVEAIHNSYRKTTAQDQGAGVELVQRRKELVRCGKGSAGTIQESTRIKYLSGKFENEDIIVMHMQNVTMEDNKQQVEVKDASSKAVEMVHPSKVSVKAQNYENFKPVAKPRPAAKPKVFDKPKPVTKPTKTAAKIPGPQINIDRKGNFDKKRIQNLQNLTKNDNSNHAVKKSWEVAATAKKI